MEFDWDGANEEHLAEHGVTVDEAEELFYNSPVSLGCSTRNNEKRHVAVGVTDAGRCLTLVYVVRAGAVRVVTAFDASERHLRMYRRKKRKR